MTNDSARAAPPAVSGPPVGMIDQAKLLEYHYAIHAFGTPEQVRAKLAALDALLEERRQRDWLFSTVKSIASWAAIVAGGWLAFRNVIAELIAGLSK